MSAEFDALKAAYEELRADNAKLLAFLDNLTKQLASDSSDTAAIVALTAEINADRAALDPRINPPAPAPAPAA